MTLGKYLGARNYYLGAPLVLLGRYVWVGALLGLAGEFNRFGRLFVRDLKWSFSILSNRIPGMSQEQRLDNHLGNLNRVAHVSPPPGNISHAGLVGPVEWCSCFGPLAFILHGRPVFADSSRWCVDYARGFRGGRFCKTHRYLPDTYCVGIK